MLASDFFLNMLMITPLNIWLYVSFLHCKANMCDIFMTILHITLKWWSNDILSEGAQIQNPWWSLRVLESHLWMWVWEHPHGKMKNYNHLEITFEIIQSLKLHYNKHYKLVLFIKTKMPQKDFISTLFLKLFAI